MQVFFGALNFHLKFTTGLGERSYCIWKWRNIIFNTEYWRKLYTLFPGVPSLKIDIKRPKNCSKGINRNEQKHAYRFIYKVLHHQRKEVKTR